MKMALLLLPCHRSRLADLENHKISYQRVTVFSFFSINYRIIIIIKFLSTVASNDTTKEQSSGPVAFFFFSFGKGEGNVYYESDRVGSVEGGGRGFLRIIPTYLQVTEVLLT